MIATAAPTGIIAAMVMKPEATIQPPQPGDDNAGVSVEGSVPAGVLDVAGLWM